MQLRRQSISGNAESAWSPKEESQLHTYSSAGAAGLQAERSDRDTMVLRQFEHETKREGQADGARNREHTSLKSISMLDKPRGSNPTSPGELPSSFSGCGMKGIDLLLAIMVMEESRAVVAAFALVMGVGAIKAEALAMSAANEATVAFMISNAGYSQ